MAKKKIKSKVSKTTKKNKVSSFIPKQFWISGLVVFFLGVIAFSPTLNNGITNWDDESYLLKTEFVRGLGGDNLQQIWTENVKSNYHPLTMMSYAIEYSIAGKISPGLIHTTNLSFHLFSSLLLLYFVFLLTRRWEIAAITSGIFALHPMHVESVAWMSERKDVLYAFFYIAGLITYFKSILQLDKRMKWLGLTLLLFVASCLSKGMAVSFPLVLLLIDYYKERSFNKDVLLEKLPYFVVALIFGFVAINAQEGTGAIGMRVTQQFNYLDRIFIASYGTATYLWKLVLPVQLSAFYDYPDKTGQMLPAIFYASSAIPIVLAFLVFKFYKTHRSVVFGIGFFVVTLLMVSQLIPVGRAVLAERYTYLPYIGLAFIIGYGFVFLTENRPSLKLPLAGLLGAWGLFLVFTTFQRTKVWKDSESLWSDVIQKQPTADMAYHNLSYFYKSNGQHDKAFPLYEQGLKINPENTDILINRGTHYYNNKKYDPALSDFSKALSLNSSIPQGYTNRGAIYQIRKKYKEAMADYTTAMDLVGPTPEVLLNRGLLYSQTNELEKAMVDYNASIALKSDFGIAYYYRSKLKKRQQQYKAALADAQTAVKYGHQLKKGYLEELGKLVNGN